MSETPNDRKSKGAKNRWKGLSAKERSDYARKIAQKRWGSLTPEQRSEWRRNRANPRNNPRVQEPAA